MEFFDEKDTELLLGESIDPSCFNDTNLGRAMDKTYEKGTLSIFSKISQTAPLVKFGIDARRLNFDTTSVSVSGDYTREEEDKPPIRKKLPGHRRPFQSHDKRRHKRIDRTIENDFLFPRLRPGNAFMHGGITQHPCLFSSENFSSFRGESMKAVKG